jgi:hypothetical protein
VILKILDRVIAAISDPTVLILFCIIAILFFMLYYKDKCVEKINQNHKEEIHFISDSIVDKLSLLNDTITKQVTLLDFLIYDKKRD